MTSTGQPPEPRGPAHQLIPPVIPEALRQSAALILARISDTSPHELTMTTRLPSYCTSNITFKAWSIIPSDIMIPNPYLLHMYHITQLWVYWTACTCLKHSFDMCMLHLRRFTIIVCTLLKILLWIYQNPIHLKGIHWRTRFWRQREVRWWNKTRNTAVKLHAV